MKRVLRTLAALILLTGLACSSQAQQKIALINLQKVFDGYFKTKLADAQIKERGKDMLKIANGMIEDGKKAQQEYNKLVENANDPAVSADEREKRKKQAEDKLKELQEIERSLQQFNRQSTEQIEEQKQRMRDNILREIQEVIETKAKSAGFGLVLDTAAQSINRTHVLLYNTGENDITEEILAKLNATAPPSLNTSSEAPSDSKGEKKPEKK